MFEKNRNLVAGGTLAVLACAYFILSFQIPLTNIDKQVGSRLMPQICGILMMLFGLWLVVDNLLKNKKGLTVVQVDEDGNEETADRPRPLYLNTVMVLLGFALYIFLMEHIGFCVSTFLYLYSQMAILERHGKRKRWVLYLIVSVISTATIYLMFDQLFHLILPRGILI